MTGRFSDNFGDRWKPLFGPLGELRKGHLYAPPEPPVPPGPYDILVSAVDGLDGASKTITTTGKEGLIARVIYRNNSAANITVTATVDGSAMIAAASVVLPKAGGCGCAMFGIRGLTAGSHTIAFAVSGGSAGLAAVRMGEITTMPATWNDRKADAIAYAFDGSQDYLDDTIDFSAAGNLTSVMAGWMHTGAYPIDITGGSTEQWNTMQAGAEHGMAAYFGEGVSPLGEQWGDLLTHRGFVSYTYDGQNREYPIMLVQEMPGCVL